MKELKEFIFCEDNIVDAVSENLKKFLEKYDKLKEEVGSTEELEKYQEQEEKYDPIWCEFMEGIIDDLNDVAEECEILNNWEDVMETNKGLD